MNNQQNQSDNVLLSESKLASEVANALMNDSRTKEAPIEVINEHGIVTLVGEVSSYDVRQAAEEIAKRHNDVIKVVNSIKVQ